MALSKEGKVLKSEETTNFVNSFWPKMAQSDNVDKVKVSHHS